MPLPAPEQLSDRPPSDRTDRPSGQRHVGGTPPPTTPSRGSWRLLGVIAAATLAGGVAGHLTADSPSPRQQSTPVSVAPQRNESALQTAIRNVQASVVEVNVNLGFGGGSQGSGVIMADSGLIVTNNHVIAGASGPVEIVTAAGQSISARIVASDEREDLAVLRPDSSPGPGVTLADDSSGPPVAGTNVFAIGSPFGLQNTVTSGVVSAFRTEAGVPLIQFDAPVNPGNSGGGLFNLAGEMVGVPTSIRSPVGGNVGIGFAVTASRVRAILATVT